MLVSSSFIVSLQTNSIISANYIYFRSKWISIHGTIYKVDCILWIKVVEEWPCFATVKQIYIPERDINNAVLLVHPLETVSYNSHLHAYEVLLPNNSIPLILRQTELTQLQYYLPLHLIKSSLKAYVCPKYEYPST